MRLATRVCSAANCARCRVKSRRSRSGRGGTKLPFSSPHCSSWAIHSASLTSLLRPGTFLRCRGLTNSNVTLRGAARDIEQPAVAGQSDPAAIS